jgi:hypothetical protein
MCVFRNISVYCNSILCVFLDVVSLVWYGFCCPATDLETHGPDTVDITAHIDRIAGVAAMSHSVKTPVLA